MGIYIPVKMPKQKSIFIEITPNGGVNEIINPLLSVLIGLATELPPHGRLIDADKLGKSIQAQTEFLRKLGIDEMTEIADLLEKGFLQEVENAETIIPAEGGADG